MVEQAKEGRTREGAAFWMKVGGFFKWEYSWQKCVVVFLNLQLFHRTLWCSLVALSCDKIGAWRCTYKYGNLREFEMGLRKTNKTKVVYFHISSVWMTIWSAGWSGALACNKWSIQSLDRLLLKWVNSEKTFKGPRGWILITLVMNCPKYQFFSERWTGSMAGSWWIYWPTVPGAQIQTSQWLLHWFPWNWIQKFLPFSGWTVLTIFLLALSSSQILSSINGISLSHSCTLLANGTDTKKHISQ